MNDIIMPGVNLDNIVNRLNGCIALLKVVHKSAVNSEFCGSALGGVCDLLESIYVDFMADIEAADDA